MSVTETVTPSLGVARGRYRAGGIHERHDPTAEDIAGRIGVRGHGDGAGGKLAAGAGKAFDFIGGVGPHRDLLARH
jgi:hypothetical protein